MISAVGYSVRRGLAVGWRSGCENFRPGVVIWVAMAAFVAGYYLHWPTNAVLDLLAAGKAAGGHWFSFLAMGFFAGLLSETLRIALVQGGRWNLRNLEDLAFKFCLFGMFGVCNDFFYAALARTFGDKVSFPVVAAKVSCDLLIYTPFFSGPVGALLTHWKNEDYRAGAWRDAFKPFFIGDRIVPVIVASWCFWLPVVCLLYSLPLILQLPLCLLATTAWSLLFISVTTHSRTAGNPAPLLEEVP